MIKNKSPQEWKYSSKNNFFDLKTFNLEVEKISNRDAFIRILDKKIVYSDGYGDLSISSSSIKNLEKIFTKNFYESLDHYCLGNQIFEDDRNTFFINVKKTSLPQRIVLDFDNYGEVSSLINIFVNLESGAKFEVLDESKYSRNSTLRIFSILNNL